MPLSLFDPRIFDVADSPPLFDSRIGPTTVYILINNVRTTVRRGSLTITDELNEIPNTCEFIIDTAPPEIGADIKIGLKNVSPANLLFAGTVQKVEQGYELHKDHPSWHVRCVDYTWLFNRRKVFRTFTDVSATIAATAIVSGYTSGFSAAGIAAGLPNITATFDGDDPMAALVRLADLIGGYAKVDYTKTAYLFITDPGPSPHPIDGTDPRQYNSVAILNANDGADLRTRVYVEGITTSVVGPSGTTIPTNASVIPIEDAAPFFSSGQAKTPDAQIITYTSTHAGGATGIVSGNVSGPGSAPTPVLAAGVAGPLEGVYFWAVSFANATGETTPGPVGGPLSCPAFTTPTGGGGTPVSGAAGPLVGNYSYKFTYVSTLGETLPSTPTTTAVCGALTPPSMSNVFGQNLTRLRVGSYQWKQTYVTAFGETLAGPAMSITTTAPAVPTAPTFSSTSPGPFMPGNSWNYSVSFVTTEGETAPGSVATYTAPGFAGLGVDSFSVFSYGGIYGGNYTYGFTIVTAMGESIIFTTLNAGTGHFTGAPAGTVSWTGSQDTAGRIQPGFTYVWAFSYFSDVWGETPISAGTSVSVGGSVPIRMLMNVPAGGSLPTGVDGIRIYRAISGGLYSLNIEYRRGSVPSQYWDAADQSENGALHPASSLRMGVTLQFRLFGSSEAGVIARRIYRTKAGTAEYYFVGEIQNNSTAFFTDSFPDDVLTQRSPVTYTTGRTAFVGIPTGPAGTIARRVYRTKVGGSAPYYLVAEVKDNSTTSITDSTPDANLSVTQPGINSAGSIFSNTLTIATGPSGTQARRIYRTKVGGGIFYRLLEIADNSTTSFQDYNSDEELNTNITAPIVSGVGQEINITSIPTGPAGTLARNIYRTKAGGSEYFFVARITGNAGASYLDHIPDDDLGAPVPLQNSAGASAVDLSIPIGPAGVTQRIIYRSKAGGGSTDLRYVGTVNDNASTTFRDTVPDTSLGRSPRAFTTIGALPGDTSLTLNTVQGFPPSGWVRAESQFIRYTGISGTTLTGIPPLIAVASITRVAQTAFLTTSTAHGFITGQTVIILGPDQREYAGAHLLTVTGSTTATYEVSGLPASPATGTMQAGAAGAITGAVGGGTSVETTALLQGVTGITTAIPVGTSLALWVQCDHPSAQSFVSVAEGPDGIHEYVVRDQTLDSIETCRARGEAELFLYDHWQGTITYETDDPLTRSGAMLHVDLPEPQAFAGEFMIQRVTITQIDQYLNTFPRYAVVASNTRYTLSDLLRHVIVSQ